MCSFKNSRWLECPFTQQFPFFAPKLNYYYLYYTDNFLMMNKQGKIDHYNPLPMTKRLSHGPKALMISNSNRPFYLV